MKFQLILAVKSVSLVVAFDNVSSLRTVNRFTQINEW